MRKANTLLLAAVLGIAGALSGTASHAQQINLSNLPPSTVVGRLGSSVSGPGQAIPFATLLAALNGITNPVGGPATSTLGDLATWANTAGSLLKDAGGGTVTGIYTWSGAQTFSAATTFNGAPTFNATITAPDGGTWSTGGIVLGQIAATTVDALGVANLTAETLNGLEVPRTPGGRISLSSTAAVMTGDVAAASGTAIFYLPYVSQTIPIWNGFHWLQYDITSSGLTFGLSATNHPSTEAFDVYAVVVSGSPVLCGIYWGANTSRSSSAGGAGSADVRVVQLNGLWVNKTAIAASNCFGGAAGATSVTIAQNQGTLLGSFFTAGNGETAFVCKPTAASGGAPVLAYISNAYNRVPVSCSNLDTATGMTTSSASWSKLGATDTIAWIDSLQQVPIRLAAHVSAAHTTITDAADMGVTVGGTGTTAPNAWAESQAPTSTIADNWTSLAVNEGFYPVLGLQTAFIEISTRSAVASAHFLNAANQEDFTIDFAY